MPALDSANFESGGSQGSRVVRQHRNRVQAPPATWATKRIVRSMLVLIFTSLAGCAAPMSTQRVGPAKPFGQNATLIFVPGIGGSGTSDATWMRGLRAGGYAGKAEFVDWTGPLEPITALWDHRRHHQQSRRIAERIRTLQAAQARAPIILVGHSAGAGLVVLALEDLPPGTQVDGVVLLAPALSRTYDLTAALRHVRSHMDVFCSDRDALVLGIGTFIFGTVDGVHGEAAGQAGFIRPARETGDQYAKVITHHFSRTRQSLGDDGGHFGSLSPNLAAALIAPLLPRSPTPEFTPVLARALSETRSSAGRPEHSQTGRAGPQPRLEESSAR